MAITNNPNDSVGMQPIIANRAPRVSDHVELGTIWIDKPANDAYINVNVVAGQTTWINCGGGSGSFAALTVNPGNATITAGNLAVTAGTVTIGAFGRGVLQSSATGVLSTSAGTNGQLLVGSTGLSPAWATITSATLNITAGAGTLQIEYPGGTAASYTTTAGGPVVPLLGVTAVIGYDANITTDGATANTIKVRLADSVTTVGALVGGVNLGMNSGICTISANSNAANAIYLHANGGVNETINIYSQLGTGVASVNVQSLVGGVTIVSGLASADAINISATNAAGGIDIDAGTNGVIITNANGPFTVATGTGNLSIGADAVQHNTTLGSTVGTAALILQSGTGDVNVTSTDEINLDATGVLELNSSGGIISIANDNVNQNVNISTQGVRTTTIGDASGASSVVINVGSGNLDLGVTASAHLTRLGSTNTTCATTVQAGSGAITLTNAGNIDIVTAAGTLLLDCTGVLELNSSAGIISIGNDAVAQNISIGSGAAARVITIGNVTDATQLVLNAGTGGIQLASTGAGDITANSSDTLLLDAAGVLELNSSAGVIGIGNDNVNQNINIGIAGTRTVTIGSNAATSSVVVDVGTGAASFGATATAHTTTIGSTTTTSTTTIQAGSGGLALSAGGLVTIAHTTDTQAAAAVTVNTNVGCGVFTGITTAATASQDFTINNSLVTAASHIIYSISNLGANDAQMIATRMVPGAGSFVVTARNDGAAALNGNVVITFMVLA